MITTLVIWIGLIAVNQAMRPGWAKPSDGRPHPYPAGLAIGLTVALVALINWSPI